MKVLIADKFQPDGVQELRSMGTEVIYEPDVTPDTLGGIVETHDPDVLIVRSTKVLPPVFEKAKRLTLVVRAGAGVDNIDVPAASARGISVANCPGKNSIAVAELVWALILATDRRVADQTIEVARIDYECDAAADGELEAALMKKIREAAAHADVLLISDYQKGAITQATAQAAI